jgi:maltoporin
VTALFSVAFAAGLAQAQDEDGFRFHGYLRSGFGVAGTGDPQEAFRAPNSGAKYRLGNETEAYVETTFAYGVRPEDDAKAIFDTRITVSYVTPTSNTNNFETTTALREAFVLATGVWKSQITPRIAALSRPSLRAYVTWARWSDGFVGLVAPLRYGADDRGFAAGVQIETWW